MENINNKNDAFDLKKGEFPNFGNNPSVENRIEDTEKTTITDEEQLENLAKTIIDNGNNEKENRLEACLALLKAFKIFKNKESECEKWCKDKINIKKNKASAMKKRAILYEEFNDQFKDYIIDASDNLILFITKKEHEAHLKEMLSSDLKSIIKLKEKFSLEKKSISIEEKISKLEKKLDKLKSQK